MRQPRAVGARPRRRFTTHFDAQPDLVRPMAADSAPAVEARTRFASTVVSAALSPRLLIPGINQRKIGSHVAKGAWRGMPIYCLTLEERATCPSSCHHWLTCYGNNMHWSRRHQHGPELEYLLGLELRAKQGEHPAGFVVRLHILGDFYDAAYVALWARWLRDLPALHVFGFTARHETSDEGLLIRALNQDNPDRWVIRFSGLTAREGAGMRAAVTLWHAPERPTLDGAVICPVQTNKTACCGTCAFCWSSTKPVAFIAHGATGRRQLAPAFHENEAPNDADSADDTHGAHTFPRPPPSASGSAQALQAPGDTLVPDADQSFAHSLSPLAGIHATISIATVPLRAVEIRAWLHHIAGEQPEPAGDEQLLAHANLQRTALNLSPIRLIPSRTPATNEIFLKPRSAADGPA